MTNALVIGLTFLMYEIMHHDDEYEKPKEEYTQIVSTLEVYQSERPGNPGFHYDWFNDVFVRWMAVRIVCRFL